MRRFSRWWMACATALVLGCGDNNPVYPVHGIVNFEGKPMLGGGSIALMPLNDQPGKTAGGVIAEDGTYKLSTYGDGDGSMEGEFRVVIYQVTETEPERTEDGQKPAKPTAAVPMADRIPEIYGDPRKSPLRTKIEAKSDNEVDFDLKRSAE